jgi:parallel beta-helix repeat protein
VDTASDGRIDVAGKSYVTVQDLEVKYTNSHAIMVHLNCHNIIVNNCTVSYCGGIGMKARLGNGIEIMDSHDISITNCTVSQGMDEGITLECCHKDTEIYNVIISHNTVSTCGSVGIDVIILRQSKSGARIHDVEISNNTAYSMGKGWIGISPNAWWTPCISLSNAYTTGVKSMYNIVVSNNDLYDSYRAGLYVKRTNDNVTITKNRIHNNDKRGIYIERGATNATLSYNLIYNNIRSGLSSAERANGSVNVYNNVFYNNGNSSYAGVRFEKDSSAVLKNNIFYSDSNAPGGATFLLSVSSPTAVITLDKNCFYGTNKNIIAWRGKNFSLAQFTNYKFQSVQDTGSIATDPKFKNAANGVFSLQKDSPCRDTGTPVGLTQDFKGTAVPQGSQVDIGAFELRKSRNP